MKRTNDGRGKHVFQPILVFLSGLIFLVIMRAVLLGAFSGAKEILPPTDALQNNLDQITSGAALDSRVFLLPLQSTIEAFLRSAPWLSEKPFLSIILGMLFTAASASVIFLSGRQSGYRPFPCWLISAAFITNPFIVGLSAAGSGVSILVFFLLIVLTQVFQWQNKRYWLGLVWIGLGAALAVAAQFSALFFLFLPVLAALVAAYREKPDNIFFTENALWIMITPLLYVFLIRFLFGMLLEGDIFAFYGNEVFMVSPAIKQNADFPILPRIAALIAAYIADIFVLYPPFSIISVLSIGVGVIKRKYFLAAFNLLIWVPLLILQSARQVGIYPPDAITLMTITACSVLLLQYSSLQFKMRRWILIAGSSTSIVLNVIHWLQIYNLV